MLKNLSLIFFFLISMLAEAQGEANNWYFGNGAGLVFDHITGSVIPTSAAQNTIDTSEGCSTISDPDGNLLFYTDGRTVWSSNYQPMPNANYTAGTGLFGDPSSTASGVIVPKPGNADQYYVFTVDEPHHRNAFVYPNQFTGTYPGGTSVPEDDDGFNNGFNYSLVDLTLNGGQGDVVATEKNIHLVTYNPSLENEIKYKCSEKITATLHADGQSYWVLTHFVDTFYAFRVDSGGVNPNPVTSSIMPTIPTDGYMVNAHGGLKASPDGSKIAIAHVQNGSNQDGFLNTNTGSVWLYDFNNATGLVSNPVNLPDSDRNPYGVEFSPDSKKLYSTMRTYGDLFLMQYNLEDNNAVVIVDTQQSYGRMGLQLAPNGKIYLCNPSNQNALNVIDSPNEVGFSCNYNVSGQPLASGTGARISLPSFIQSYFFVGFEYNNPCLGEEASFLANIPQAFDSLIWDFGDGNTSIDENPTHTYAAAGDYEVSLSVTAGSENSLDVKTITVYELPVVTPIVELKQCDDDLDGFTSFNLNEANAEISVNYENETITYYESQLDAENASNAILNITDYINQVVSTDSVWARVVNSNGCYAISQINLIVSATQIQQTFIREFYQCDDGTDTTDGIATFNLSSINNEVQDLFPAGQQLTINYYKTVADALAEVNAIADISNYQNIGFPNTQNIFIRVDSSLNNDCLGLGHHITLHVDTIPIANAVTVADQCDDDGDGSFAFDTSAIEATLLNGQTNVTVSYTDSLGNPLPSPLPNPFNTASQTITARVTNTTSQDLDGACYDETPIVFTVDAAAVAHPVADIIVCDDATNDGLVNFDTATIEATVLNGQSGMDVSYSDSDGMALPSPLPNPFSTASQSITVRVENQLSASCYDETVINLIVSQQPIANPIADDFVCDDLLNDGEHIFTLSDYDSQILNVQSSATFEVFYFQNEADAIANMDVLPNLYTVNSTSQTIYARIQNRSNPNCFNIIEFQLGVHYLPMAHQPQQLLICDDESNDGMETFDLSVQNIEIINGQSATENIVSYYTSLEDAEISSNPIGTNFTNTENPQTIYARLENSNFNECYTTTSFQLLIKEQPVLLMDDETPICEGNTVQLIADSGYDYYTWSTGQTTRSITVDAPGNYTVTASNDYGSLICSTEKTISVVISNIATITNIDTVDWTQNANVISVFVEGNGDYEYSIDGFNYQDDNLFSNLSIDDYTVYVKDKKGCGISTEAIYLLYYPKFFTPNGDDVNDYWQIINSAKEPNNELYIYNRYGKLVTRLKPTDFGWDGTYNGNRLPTSDYWFVLQRQNGKKYTGHFTLKR